MKQKPGVRYVIVAAGGELAGVDLNQPFLDASGQNHASLSWGDYFHGVEHFLRRHACTLAALTGQKAGRGLPPAEIEQMIIRSEKHGAFYHISCVEVLSGGTEAKFTVSTAVSPRGRAWMKHEFNVLGNLNKMFNLPYLPPVYVLDEVNLRLDNGGVPATMFLSGWFDGYHEWHLTRQGGEQNIEIWDVKNGYRPASAAESYAIYQKASQILTLYYNPADYSEIYPWHHAAGDFVVRTGGEVDVKLITARKYGPVLTFPKAQKSNSFIALVYFFINLTVQMRLDKYNGVGDAAWAQAACLPAVVEGFFAAWREKEKTGGCSPGRVEEIWSLLKSFGRDELKNILYSLPAYYRREDPADLALIESNLDKHAGQLHDVLQDFDPRPDVRDGRAG
ncbi:hypothetical protein [Desulfotomaculum copahuensis]|uniref:Uncharacterized protein n=1 Tax=Desulfotomaculum copahuensis TaxID=1838280 RepID=A0A1B7LD85_9FIRM|nr:hypothetical protein [Desulfotomaculum copahuensis]OAT80835.1 hypothetical protein A6M21_12230 [Desulfotomaculum copahuensis]